MEPEKIASVKVDGQIIHVPVVDGPVVVGIPPSIPVEEAVVVTEETPVLSSPPVEKTLAKGTKSNGGKNGYRALVGLDYKHKDTGESLRVEKGEKIEGLNEIAVKNELRAGNIEEWSEENQKVGE